MPTAPKLIAALLFAALAYFVSDLVKPLLPDGTQVGLLSQVNALVGAFFGWRIMGMRAGNSMQASLGYGLTTAFAITFWSLLIWCGYLMVIQSTRLRYSGPLEAIQGMFEMMWSYALAMATAPVLGSLILGALVFGWLTEQVARRYS
jgi:hypothetical protein